MWSILCPRIVALSVVGLEHLQDVVLKDLVVDISNHLFPTLKKNGGIFFPSETMIPKTITLA